MGFLIFMNVAYISFLKKSVLRLLKVKKIVIIVMVKTVLIFYGHNSTTSLM